jgi:hypothetical protein
MSQNFDLKAIEQKAFRSFHQDGLMDIYIGALALARSLFFAIPESGEGEGMYMGLALLGVAIAFAIFRLGKQYITTPRLGQVRFGPERQQRKATMMWVMAGFVLVTFGIFAYSVFVWKVGMPVPSPLSPSLERGLVALIAGLISGASVIVKSYFMEFVRGYYIGFALGCGLFFTILLNSVIPVIAAGALILVPGLVIFVNFLRQHPLPPREVRHGNP